MASKHPKSVIWGCKKNLNICHASKSDLVNSLEFSLPKIRPTGEYIRYFSSTSPREVISKFDLDVFLAFTGFYFIDTVQMDVFSDAFLFNFCGFMNFLPRTIFLLKEKDKMIQIAILFLMKYNRKFGILNILKIPH